MEARALEARGLEPRVLEPRVLEARAMEARVMEPRGLEPRGPGPNPRGPMPGGIQGPGPLNMGASGPQGPRQVCAVSLLGWLVSCRWGLGGGCDCVLQQCERGGCPAERRLQEAQGLGQWLSEGFGASVPSPQALPICWG